MYVEPLSSLQSHPKWGGKKRLCSFPGAKCFPCGPSAAAKLRPTNSDSTIATLLPISYQIHIILFYRCWKPLFWRHKALSIVGTFQTCVLKRLNWNCGQKHSGRGGLTNTNGCWHIDVWTFVGHHLRNLFKSKFLSGGHFLLKHSIYSSLVLKTIPYTKEPYSRMLLDVLLQLVAFCCF